MARSQTYRTQSFRKRFETGVHLYEIADVHLRVVRQHPCTKGLSESILETIGVLVSGVHRNPQQVGDSNGR